ncbi:hypothetical protein WQE_13841 [Paraburkholderia hospita]|uniref:Uncharacterized protein n=1 Tax=Paraburkholderia hospita TaxID=169430 RepID=A0ABP2PRN5_9BURK|nr:hypothetical protein WQE_13841 [Paraburkholderia hospita]OUL88228.1 hypothetical protein CA602_11595 [Paraburkholderia hospita]
MPREGIAVFEKFVAAVDKNGSHHDRRQILRRFEDTLDLIKELGGEWWNDVKDAQNQWRSIQNKTDV